MSQEISSWVARPLQILGRGCNENEANPRSKSFNGVPSFKNELTDVKVLPSQRPSTTMMGEGVASWKQHPSPSTKKRERRRVKSDSSIDKCSELLNVANLSLAKPKCPDDQQKRAVKNTSSKGNPKQMGTAIADMSKIITKYDEAERRYIGTTIELVKKDSKKLSSGISIWNKIPTHRLGYPNEKKQIANKARLNLEELDQKLKTTVAVNSCELQDRCSDAKSVPKQIKKDLTSITHVSNTGLKARSERVTKFLTDAFEANADILRLGIPFRSAESKIPLIAGNCMSCGSDEAADKLNSKPLLEFAWQDGKDAQSKPKQDNSKRLNVSCIHFKNEDIQMQGANLNKKGERCDVCHQSRDRTHKDWQHGKVPQAPPTTPTRQKEETKRRTKSLCNRQRNDDFDSRL